MSVVRVGRCLKPAGLLGILLVAVIGATVPAAWALNPVPAAPTYTAGTSFGANPGSRHAAVEPSTGNLLVTVPGSDQVEVRQPDGSVLTTFSTGAATTPDGIAIDPTSGAVYLSLDGTLEIVRYISDGASTPTYTKDATYSSPSGIVIPGALSIDPVTHDLLVADQLSHRVYRITPLGSQSDFGPAGPGGGSFTNLVDVAAAPNGHVYVVDSTGNDLYYPGNDSSHVTEFDSTGTPVGDLTKADGSALNTPDAVAVDPSSGRAIVSGDTNWQATPSGPRLYVYDGGLPAIATFEYPGAAFTGVPSVALASDPGRAHRLYSVLPSAAGTQPFDLSVTPALDIDSPTQVSGTSMHVSGTVNPSGFAATGSFEYSDDGGATYKTTPVQALGSGSVDVAISADITNLTPVHDYRVRLAATASAGTVRTAPLTAHTTTAPPVVTTGGAADRTTSSATLRGTVNPGGLQTTYHFEYGTTTSYGGRAPLTYDPVAGNGGIARSVSVGAKALAPGTTYHYRIVATNSAGRSEGEDRTFVTATADDGRAYEMVSPTQKGGGGVANDGVKTSDGNTVVFRTHSAVSGSLAGPIFPTSIARRSATGWSSRGLDIPQGLVPSQLFYQTVVGVSDDLSKVVGASSLKLADGAVDGYSNYYLVDTSTGKLRTLGAVPGLVALARSQEQYGRFDPALGTPDFRRVLFHPTNAVYLPGSEVGNVYQWTDGVVEDITVDDTGTPFPTPDRGTGISISEDGNRLFYNDPARRLYLRDHGQVVSVTDGTAAGEWGPTTPDGGSAFLIGSRLTSDSQAYATSVYRINVATRQLTFIAPSGGTTAGNMLGASSDGSYFYFYSPDNLAPGGAGGGIYVWHDGDIRYAMEPFANAAHAQVSPNGRYLMFASNARVTDYDPSAATACAPDGACTQTYRYSYETNDVVCASCRPDDAAPTGAANPGKVLDDGTVIFDTTEPLASGDSNSKRDVYAFDGTQATLISGGTSVGNSLLVSATADGRDIFFVTNDRLVAQDIDNQNDVYDARRGGGIPAQQKIPALAPCSGEGCLGAPLIPPPPPGAAVVTFGAGGNLSAGTPQSSKVKVSVAHKTVKGSVFNLTVKTANKGRIVASGSGLATVKRTATKAGTYKLTMRLTKAAKRRLRAKGRVAIKVRLTFTPTAATPSTTTVSLTLKG
jgi:hypothetical protein